MKGQALFLAYLHFFVKIVHQTQAIWFSGRKWYGIGYLKSLIVSNYVFFSWETDQAIKKIFINSI